MKLVNNFYRLNILGTIFVFCLSVIPINTVNAGTYIELTTEFSPYATGSSSGGNYNGDEYWDNEASIVIDYNQPNINYPGYYNDYEIEGISGSHLKIDVPAGQVKLRAATVETGIEINKLWLWVGGGTPPGGYFEYYYDLNGINEHECKTDASDISGNASWASGIADNWVAAGGETVSENRWGNVRSNEIGNGDWTMTGNPDSYNHFYYYNYDLVRSFSSWALEIIDGFTVTTETVINMEFAFGNVLQSVVRGVASQSSERCEAEYYGSAGNRAWIDYEFYINGE